MTVKNKIKLILRFHKQVDAHEVPLLSQLIVNWSLTTGSYPLLCNPSHACRQGRSEG